MNKVLIIEDDIFLGKMYSIKLKQAGIESSVILNGTSAISQINEYKPSAILLDLMMPEKNGFEVLKELESQEHLKQIPVVVVTKLSSQEDREKCLALGVNDYISKLDMSFSEVIKTLKKYLD